VADERNRAIETALAALEKQFGKGSVMRLGSKEAIGPIAVISTGSISFDAATGVGGVPRGRVIEVFGPESSGKTTISLQIIAEAQKAGGLAAFVDAEHALDPAYAKKLGVDIDNLLISQPDYGEQALEIVEALVRSGAIDVLVVDSVAALVPKAELDGEMGDSHMGLQARLMSQALRKLTGTVSKSRTCLIFINQIREKIGVMFGNPETTTGGKALKFYSSMRIDIRRIGAVKEGAPRSRSSRTRSPLPSATPSSTSSTVRESPRRVMHSTSPSSTTSSTRAARGTASRESASARAARTCAHSSRRIKKSSRASTPSYARSSASAPQLLLPRFHPSQPAPRSPPTKPSRAANSAHRNNSTAMHQYSKSKARRTGGFLLCSYIPHRATSDPEKSSDRRIGPRSQNCGAGATK
jgi:protein RecA